ncbi:protein disulfide-isomerase [Melanotaenia boesemani]|uniref:protein disulfide-isomerase n=1 Tax=Melanotaenia boesemani TaxID=1250792 RepID=UPI001C04B77D|nr:protein disulfide-isomerase [Melanotaenia boesemani]
MKTLQLLGVTAICLFVFAAADAQSNLQGDETLPEKDGVLQLEKRNFDKALRKHKQLLVHFYAPLTGEAQRVSAAFEGAAEKLQGSEVKLAVVDVTSQKDLTKELNATGHPTIRLYLSGDKYNPVACPVPRSSASILTWLKRRAGSAADLITDLSQLEASEELTVVGFFKDLNHEYVQVFYAASVDLPDIKFAVTQDDEVTDKYGPTHDVVLLLRESELIQTYKMTPQTSKEELTIFISVYKLDPVTEYNGKTASEILSSPVLNHALLFVNKSSADFKEIFSAFSNAADSFRLKILFVLVNVDEPRNGRLMEYFRVRDFEAPLIRLVNLTDHVTYHLPSDTLNVENIKQFCHSYLEGKAKPKLQSEPTPEGWDQRPVKELVGFTFEKVAFNPNKTVFVLFYLPYSQKSRAVFPLWEELAEAFKEQQDVVIARIDASANDINMSMQGAYPSLCLFPALYAERMVVYTGKRKLKNLIKFVEKEMEKAKKYRVMEDEDRRKYTEALKAEEAKKDKETKDEL